MFRKKRAITFRSCFSTTEGIVTAATAYAGAVLGTVQSPPSEARPGPLLDCPSPADQEITAGRGDAHPGQPLLATIGCAWAPAPSPSEPRALVEKDLGGGSP